MIDGKLVDDMTVDIMQYLAKTYPHQNTYLVMASVVNLLANLTVKNISINPSIRDDCIASLEELFNSAIEGVKKYHVNK